MAKYIIVDSNTGKVLNVTSWDGDTNKWKPPDGTLAVEGDASIGVDLYDLAEKKIVKGKDPDYIKNKNDEEDRKTKKDKIIEKIKLLKDQKANDKEVQECLYYVIKHYIGDID